MAYVDLDELPGLLGGRLVRARARARALPPPRLPRRSRPCRWPTPCARWSPSAPARAPDGPDPPADPPAHASGTASTRSASTTASRADGERSRRSSPRSRTRRGASATPTCCARRDDAGRSRRLRQGAARLAVHGHGPALRVARARARRRRSSVHIESREDGGARSTRRSACAGAADRRASPRRRPLPGGDAADARPHLRPRRRAEAQGRPGPTLTRKDSPMTERIARRIVLTLLARIERRPAHRGRGRPAPRVRLAARPQATVARPRPAASGRDARCAAAAASARAYTRRAVGLARPRPR